MTPTDERAYAYAETDSSRSGKDARVCALLDVAPEGVSNLDRQRSLQLLQLGKRSEGHKPAQQIKRTFALNQPATFTMSLHGYDRQPRSLHPSMGSVCCWALKESSV